MSEEQFREQRPLDNLVTTDNNSSQRLKAQHAAPNTSQYGQPSVARTASVPPIQTHNAAGHGRSMELPPLPQVSSATGGSFPSIQRSIGVSSILNPVNSDDQPQTRRRKASELSPPPPPPGPSLPPLNSSYRPAQSVSGTPTPSSMSIVGSLGGSGDRPPRRILTPRSPSLHRAASLNQLSQPASATYSAQHAPFAVSPRSRVYAIEPGTSGAPPLPTPPAGILHASHGISAPTPPLNVSRNPSAAAHSRMRHPSESTSPRSSYSSYSQAASPATYAPSAMPTLSSAYPTGTEGSAGSAAGGNSTSAPASGESDRQGAIGMPISSSGGQNVYQMMTLETTSGTVQLPVDVQAASRVADEKRRRNAGASARFRQRRKEKEKEASTTIGRLEQQVKELSEDLEFYKRERDYMAGVILQAPGGDRHFPRPQSPRHRRTSSLGAPGPSASGVYMHPQESGAHSPEGNRNVRRRTSTLSLPPPNQATTYAAYAQTNYGPPLAPQPHPPTVQMPGSGHLPPPSQASQLMQAPPQTGPPAHSWQLYHDRQGPQQSRDNRYPPAEKREFQ